MNFELVSAALLLSLIVSLFLALFVFVMFLESVKEQDNGGTIFFSILFIITVVVLVLCVFAKIELQEIHDAFVAHEKGRYL